MASRKCEWACDVELVGLEQHRGCWLPLETSLFRVCIGSESLPFQNSTVMCILPFCKRSESLRPHNGVPLNVFERPCAPQLKVPVVSLYRCRNISVLQSCLSKITLIREKDLDRARKYFEMLYLNQEVGVSPQPSHTHTHILTPSHTHTHTHA